MKSKLKSIVRINGSQNFDTFGVNSSQNSTKATSINDVRRFLAIFDLPT